MGEKKVENGLVCFFDILGYQNILINNSINDCAIIIKEILLKTPKNVLENILDTASFDEPLYNEIKMFFEERLDYIMVSDSIIMFFDYDNLDNIEISNAIMYSMFFITYFKYLSFKSGFPMRSCIDFGQFYFTGNIFAGSTIVNCYNESEKLDFSGIVMTENAYNFISNKIDDIAELHCKNMITTYLVPLKSGDSKMKHIVDWYTEPHFHKPDDDVKQFIFNAFHMHNKMVDQTVIKKINNTENIIRYFLYRKNMKIKRHITNGNSTPPEGG